MRPLHTLDISKQISFIDKAVSTKETRFVTRCIRQLPSIRRRLLQPVSVTGGPSPLIALVHKYCPADVPLRAFLPPLQQVVATAPTVRDC